ncbi:hypothetical protein WA556_006316 [Blastocystis sp. ATCC 50177/Nand II]
MYELLHRIGDDKCGNTFEAINTNTSERCVVRRERLSRITFKSEGKNLVDYRDVYMKGNELWFISEFCRCGSIETLLKEGKQFSEEELREIASCVLLALQSLHERSYVHGVALFLTK